MIYCIIIKSFELIMKFSLSMRALITIHSIVSIIKEYS